MKIYRDVEFVPITIKLETRKEAELLLAMFNRSPESASEFVEGKFTGNEILQMERFSSSKSWYVQLRDAMGLSEVD